MLPSEIIAIIASYMDDNILKLMNREIYEEIKKEELLDEWKEMYNNKLKSLVKLPPIIETMKGWKYEYQRISKQYYFDTIMDYSPVLWDYEIFIKDDLLEKKKIDFDCMRMGKIPVEVCGLIKLEYVDFQYNDIKKIPNEIKKMVNLRELGLNNNKIRIIPLGLCELINLCVLELEYNELMGIPKEIGKLINLLCLRLKYNSIEEIPIEIGNLIKLQRLDFYKNKIKEIPDEIDRLVDMQYLRFKNNQIDGIPEDKHNLMEIENMDGLHGIIQRLIKKKNNKIVDNYNGYNWVDKYEYE